MYYSPALFVRTAPEDGYRSISMVNLSYICLLYTSGDYHCTRAELNAMLGGRSH